MLGSAPRSLRILVRLILAVIVLGAAYLYLPAVGAVSGEALQYSLARELGGQRVVDDGNTCVRRVPGIWRCAVDDREGSNNEVTYELTRRGRRCWDAVAVTAGRGELAQRVSGCVGARDQLRLAQRL